MRRLRRLLAALALPVLAGGLQAGEPPLLRLSTDTAQSHRVNQALADRVVHQFRSSGQLRQYSIDVETNGGAVTLMGSVASAEQKARATQLAQSVAGVTNVRNQLRIAGTATNYVAKYQPNILPVQDLAQEAISDPAPMADFAGGIAPYSDSPVLPPYSWPAYTPYNNYASMAYQTQYPSGAWPFIGPPHPYPMIPSGWRRATLTWRKGYWWLRFRAF